MGSNPRIEQRIIMSTVLAKADALQSKKKNKPLRNGKIMKARGSKKPLQRKAKVNYRTTTQLRSDKFLAEIKDATRVTFISHINPDPDSLGSMIGLAHLVKSVLGKKTRLTRDGLINRSENRAMVDLLGLELTPVDEIEWNEGDVAVMVDSQPKTGRHSNEKAIPLVAVIDHHDTPGNVRGIPFVDVRKSMGATCSVVAEYLREQNIEVSFKVATAMMYGMETELMGFPRHASTADLLIHRLNLCSFSNDLFDFSDCISNRDSVFLFSIAITERHGSSFLILFTSNHHERDLLHLSVTYLLLHTII